MERGSSITTFGEVMMFLNQNLNKDDERPVVRLGTGDPSCFLTATIAEDAVVNALRSANFNCYPPINGLLSARRYYPPSQSIFFFFFFFFLKNIRKIGIPS